MFKSFKQFTAYRIMTLSSFFGVCLFYLVASEEPRKYLIQYLPSFLQNVWMWTLLVVLLFLLLSWLSLQLACKTFPNGNTLDAEQIKPIENIAMPTYIGMFVIALEISGSLNVERSAIVLFLLLILWGLFERVFYFNPVWLIFKYRFYEVKSEAGNTFTVISKQKNLKGARSFSNLRKINEYTYLE